MVCKSIPLNPRVFIGELPVLVTISILFLFMINEHEKKFLTVQQSLLEENTKIFSETPNVHQKFYAANSEKMEKRFPHRKHNDPLAYIKQVLIVFGGAIVLISFITRKFKFKKSYSEAVGLDVTVLCCLLNLIFAYAFGFVAVVNDWWFFFPDLITKDIWQIRTGQMVLGDVLFYPMAVIMGHRMMIFTVRIENPLKNRHEDALLKSCWFVILFTIALFGVTFGSEVMKGMILWLYLPFGLAGLLFYKKYTAFQLWSVTFLFILCEFLWDAVARVRGIWIFPDATTHPGLFFDEINLFNIGCYSIIWQPEMTQMAFVSGMICLVLFHAARLLLDKQDKTCG